MGYEYENLVGLLKIAIQALEQIKTREICVDEDELYELVDTIFQHVVDLIDN